MELTFLENDGKWIAEFKVDKEFNLHIEREDGTGKIKMYQNSATGGKYAIVEDFAINNNYKPVLDFSSGYFVGEKSIKIVSEVLPTYAAITTDGDVVEIKSQAKVVEITSNGTTSVEPDAGFSYLSKVDVKTNVATSGEGGGGSAIGSGLTYYKFPTYATLEEVSETDIAVVYNAARVKMEMSGVSMVGLTYIGGGKYREDNILTVRAFAIDKSARFIMAIGGQIRSDGTLEEYLEEYLAQTGGSLSNYEEITEEEFYNLES